MLNLSRVLLVGCKGEETPVTIPEDAEAGDIVNLEPCTYEQMLFGE